MLILGSGNGVVQAPIQVECLRSRLLCFALTDPDPSNLLSDQNPSGKGESRQHDDEGQTGILGGYNRSDSPPSE